MRGQSIRNFSQSTRLYERNRRVQRRQWFNLPRSVRTLRYLLL